uniref:Neur_chan_LBD domain-containing protein n=1 Tax=Angiostrongylus cantonensis TaxID=6313 RepID=A0A0K0CUK2_ANGCA
MVSLLFWQCSVLGVLARYDSPIVDVYLTVNAAGLFGEVLRTSITMEQTWTDQRLSFQGVSEVPIFECPLQLTSFSSRGCDEITYTIERIDIDRVARISNATVIEEFFDSHLNQTLNMATVVLYLEKPHQFHRGSM